MTREIEIDNPYRSYDLAAHIDTEEFPEEEAIKKSITEPVKGKVTYDDDAINRIIWYSGKNLYCQQLICYYIVNHLNKEKRNRCLLKDVEETIQQILNERIPGLVEGWENKMSLENRLIAAAVADESITKRRGNSYYIHENTLLDDIFGKKNYDEIKKLQELGYLNETQGRRFSKIPFKIPLYGKWIQNEHPFIKTVIEEIEVLADKIDLHRLIEELKKTPQSKLTPFNKETMLEIAEKWHLLKNFMMKNHGNAEKNQIENFFETFSKRLNLNIKDKPKPGVNYFKIDIENLNIGILDEALCFFQDSPELSHDEISNIENTAVAIAQRTAQTRLILFLYFQESEMVESLVRKTYLNLIAIDENDIKKIIFSITPAQRFRKVILSKLSLQKISPYKTAGPTTTTFYGRSDIINRISGSVNTSFAIVGARKIGKTSLLYKIKENPPQNTTYIYMNLELVFSDAKSNKPFLKSLESEIELVFNKKNAFGKLPFGKKLSKLPNIIRGLAGDGEKIVFIFDEIDGLIACDRKQNFKLMRLFRTMSQQNVCQFIFSGFRELHRQKREIENPMYNFYEEIRLAPLEKKSALTLITGPMKSIGIQYKNEEDREAVLDYTACHPNLLQFFCKQLVEIVEKHENVEERRTISREDIDNLYDTTYEKYIMDEVYMFNSDLDDIDKLILILLAEEESYNKSFSPDETRNKLTRHGIRISMNQVHQQLSNLVMRFILLDKTSDRYSFALPFFPGILRKRIDNDYKNQIIRELQKNE